MDFTVERGALNAALAQATAVVERRNTIPVLANVLLDAKGDELRLVATDLDTMVSLSLPAKVKAEGATTIEAHTLHSIARELPDGSQVELKLDDSRVQLASARSRYKLNALPPTDFPILPFEGSTARFTIGTKLLASMLGKVSHAMADDREPRDYLRSVLFEASGDKLVLAATNGHALASAHCDLPMGAEAIPAHSIFPRKLVLLLQRLVAERDEDAELTIDGGKVRIAIGQITLTARLNDATYPDWRRVMPTANGKRLCVDARSFAAGLRRTILIANEKTRGVRMSMEADKLSLHCTAADAGSASEEIPAAWDAGALDVGFNARYLLETLNAAGGEQIEAQIADARAPALFTNPTDSTALWVVMPMRV